MTNRKNKFNGAYIDIEGRKKNIFDKLYNFICVLSCGVLYTVCKYYPNIKIFLTSFPCSLQDADCVLIKNQYNKKEFRNIVIYHAQKTANLKRYVRKGEIRILDTEYSRLIYDYVTGGFVTYNFEFDEKLNFEDIYFSKINQTKVSEKIELLEKDILFGKNLNNYRLPSIIEIFLKNTFSVTLLVNLFCIILWFNIEYKIYGSIIGIMVLYGYIEENYTEIKHKFTFERAQTKRYVRVLRQGKFVSCDSKNIYPGDVIYIEPCKEFYCDAMLLRGDVITDESFLTGESVPICKSSSNKSIVYSGTSVLKSVNDTVNTCSNINLRKLCRVKNLTKSVSEDVPIKIDRLNLFENNAIGMVVATGFNTSRGQIMKDIMSPKPVTILFLREAYSSIFYIVILSFVLSIFLSFYLNFVLKWTFKDNFVYTFDLFFTLASPALYASLSVGIQISNKKLKNNGIICNNVDRIYLAGNVDTAIFDKTGTLTNEGVDLLCIDNLTNSYTNVENIDYLTRVALSTCHSVYELDGKYSGDILDVKMFIFSETKLTQRSDNIRNIIIGDSSDMYGPFLKEYDDQNKESVFYQQNNETLLYKGNKCHTIDFSKSSNNVQVDILKCYEFSSDLRRMSVIVQDKNRKIVFCKGSPDCIGEILNEKPKDYDTKIKEYSLLGYRVITLGYKEIDKIETREECEKSLKFLCLIVFSNKLKSETTKVIEELNNANIKSVICTGDNILTAISVGRECNLIDNFCSVIFPIMDENSKTVYDVDWVCLGDEELVFDKVRLTVYKNDFDTFCEDFVVACEGKEYEFFRKTDYFSFILKKGAVFARFSPNQKKQLVEDLRNIGRSVLFCGDGANDSGALGSADVGIALAENEASLASSFSSKNIEAVPNLIKEGRAAYVTSLARFKFVELSYILAYASLAFLILRNMFLSDFQTLHVDIFIIAAMVFFISSLNKSKKLSVKSPDDTIFGKKFIIPFLVSATVQVIILGVLSRYGEDQDEISEFSKAGTLVFFVTAYQSIFNGIYFGNCAPHVESIIDNKKFVIFSFLTTSANTVLLLLLYFCPKFVNKWLSIYLFVEITTKEFFYIIIGTLMSLFACFFLPMYIRTFFEDKNEIMFIDEERSTFF